MPKFVLMFNLFILDVWSLHYSRTKTSIHIYSADSVICHFSAKYNILASLVTKTSSSGKADIAEIEMRWKCNRFLF